MLRVNRFHHPLGTVIDPQPSEPSRRLDNASRFAGWWARCVAAVMAWWDDVTWPKWFMSSCDNHAPECVCDCCASPRGFYIGDELFCKDCRTEIHSCRCLGE
jgi:hypothetical protein